MRFVSRFLYKSWFVFTSCLCASDKTWMLKNNSRISTTENSMEVPQEIKTGRPYDPEIPLLGVYPKEMKLESQRGICTPMFIAELFIIAKKWKLPVHQQLSG